MAWTRGSAAGRFFKYIASNMAGSRIPNTGEPFHIGQALLALKGGFDDCLHMVFNYPTRAECYKVAALNALNKLKCQP